MLLDMHWLDDVRPPPPSAPPLAPRRRRSRSPQGFLQPGLSVLGPLVGHWDAEINLHAGGFVHQDLRARGRCHIRVGSQGHTLEMESRLTGWMGTADGHAVIAPEAVPGTFSMFVAEPFAPASQAYAGQQIARDAVVFEGAAELGGVSGVVRRTLRYGADAHGWTVAFWSEGDVIRLITGRLRRRAR